MKRAMTRTGDRVPHVLFLNTRSQLGADVAVHVTLMRSLDPSRCRVTLATNRCSPDHERLMAEVRGVPGLRVVTLNLGYEVSDVRGMRRIWAVVGNLLALAASLVRLVWLVRRSGVDIVHTTDRPRDALMGVLVARLARRRSLVHLHVMWGDWMGRATSWGVAHADGVLAISQFVRKSLLAGGVPEGKIYAVLNAVETERYDPDTAERGALRRALQAPDGDPLIGIVARVIVWKGHLDLVKALALVVRRFPGVKLAIVGRSLDEGPGSYRQAILDCAKEHGIAENVLWAGWRNDPALVFGDLDVVCVPSYEEPFGLVVIEAMAMRRAVVAYDSGALPEIITSGVDGLLVPAKDVEALAEAICSLLADEALRRRLGEAGRRTVLARFGAKRQAEEVLDVYRRVCGMTREQ